jgi:transposase-like protein
MSILTPPVYKEKRAQGRRPKYTPEYYMLMCKRVVEEGLSYREAAKLYKMSHGSISYWVGLHKSGKIPGKVAKAKKHVESQDGTVLRLEAFIVSLKTEIGELYLENQILKKARVFLQEHKKSSSSAITSENLDQWKKGAR